MTTIDRDGVKIAYDDAGKGPALVFVHGGLCDRSNWEFQTSHFKHAHRVITLDLPGHGGSGKPKSYDGYTIDGFADDVAWLCYELDVSQPVIVGHSMGGLIALAVAGRHSNLPAAVAMIDAPLLLSESSAVPPFPLDADPAELRESVVSFFSLTGFAPTDDPARKAAILDTMAATPTHVVASVMTQIVGWNGAAAAESCALPVLDLRHTGAPITDLSRLKQLCPQVVIGRTVGSGHWGMLEIPDQVNAVLEQFIRHADMLADASRVVPW